MYSIIRWYTILIVLLFVASLAHASELRVCADPNNLPFSNDKGQGFENKLAELLARQMGATVHYTWWAQRRGSVRNTLKARRCDVWLGVASGYERAETTRAYYRSSYVFVTRRDRNLNITSFDDPRLHTLLIGVQLVGDDGTNTPPTYALVRRGIINNVRGYSLFGDYSRLNPPRAIVDAVEKGNIDVAVVWGPLAGYFAALEPRPLTITPVEPQFDQPGLPMAFNIAMGLRHGNTALKDEIDRLLQQNQTAIAAILTEYHVPWTAPIKVVSTGSNPFLIHRIAPTLLHKPEQQ
jgi:mxaJ protein